MKFTKQLIVAILFITSFISCEKNEDDLNISLNEETISAKWIVEGSSDYESFEYNESGNYIIVKNTTVKSTKSQIVLFGTYQIIDNKTIVLSDFGTMSISNIEENLIGFLINLDSNPANEITVNAVKQDEIANSTKTKLLCRTWELVSFGETDIGDFIILFSDAGTYFVEGGSESGEGTLGTWKWCNPEETKLAFTVDNFLDCDGLEIIEEIQLTSDSFTGIDMENGEPEVMVMKPVSSVKLTRVTKPEIDKGILGRMY
ncbi:MAG: hypothetical protein DRJ01_16205 [Bacteroidetes bacterium]|nr:MAG: hypothetical protein DRJ01_16205 [Bacteroidota bacterium]